MKQQKTFSKSLKKFSDILTPGANIVRLFCPQFTNFHDKLECLLNSAGKACQGQTLELITKTPKLQIK